MGIVASPSSLLHYIMWNASCLLSNSESRESWTQPQHQIFCLPGLFGVLQHETSQPGLVSKHEQACCVQLLVLHLMERLGFHLTLTAIQSCQHTALIYPAVRISWEWIFLYILFWTMGMMWLNSRSKQYGLFEEVRGQRQIFRALLRNDFVGKKR